ncbi:MAG: hypothetical protein US54_C0044G0007 [Candidatus Roizmanbacteria bacterium GW2011_GWA2_37_7]|uniref:Transposase IS200-like domain-containing protein n=1 Tax=Candidatus Roizmanbacteria bacterium GW2011_GWA2_37_7 TaxID=1618481 RepID=A0A0G0H1M2_9BACT|nr:MAG: hypothetical protein US54_C0044G0007 [Candidatus Roizmanbacteria bacterium GW2011_GWA2_37_7]
MDKFIRKRNRLQNYDYSQSAWYYVTVCPNIKKDWFGKFIGKEIQINDEGIIIEERWRWLEDNFSNVKIKDFVIMPDHFHGVISINSVVTGLDLSLQKQYTLSNIIGAFKTTSSKQIHLSGYNDFKWQRSFYDRIIRNETDYLRIKKYIFDNPLDWYLEHRDRR